MSKAMNFDVLTLVCHELYCNRSISHLRSAANVCRAWRYAALPFLFRHIQVDFSPRRERQLEKWAYSPLSQDSPLRFFVRQVKIQGTRTSLLNNYLDHLIHGLFNLPNLGHFSWCFRGNIPRRLVAALNQHYTLESMHLWIYINSVEEMELTNTLVAGSKTFSLMIEGTHLPPDERDPSGKHGLDILSDTGFLLDHHDERTALMAPDDSVTTRGTKQSTSGLESLILRGVAIQSWELWQNGAFIMALSFRHLKRLALVDCNDPMLISWTQHPQALESLEIVNPNQTYPYKSGQFLTGKQLAEPIEYFCHLSELNLQNVGAPICEVLTFLSAEAGAQLKVLKLHDQNVTGVDQLYTIRCDYGPEQDCPLYKLLVYVCPNLEVLSLDVSSNFVEDQPLDRHVRTMDIGYEGLRLRLEQMNSASTLPVFDTLRSLRRLHSLRLVVPDAGKARSGQTADMIARRTCSSELRYFTLAVSACRSTGHIGDVEDVFRLDPDSAWYRGMTSYMWRTSPIHTWRHRARA